jgi:hypothetical protein
MENEFAAGEYVLLNKYSNEWSPSMLPFSGKHVKIRVRSGRVFVIEELPGSDHLFYIKDILRHSTKEEIELAIAERAEMFRKRLENIEKDLGCPIAINAETVGELAKDIFSEERVDINLVDNAVIIYFPEIIITNSKNLFNKVDDLYIRFKLNQFDIESCWLGVAFEGTRTKLTLRDFQSNYTHSHLHGSSRYKFSNFCLGSSDFNLILQEIMSAPTKYNWELLLMSLENYLKWESLEGGPYCKIEDIKYRNSHIEYESILNELYKWGGNIPNTAFDLVRNSFTVSAINKHFAECVNEYAGIRDAENYTNEQLDSWLSCAVSDIEENSTPLIFKGNIIPRVVYYNEVAEEGKKLPVSIQLMSQYATTLSDELKQFSKEIIYEQHKKRNKDTVFGQTTII